MIGSEMNNNINYEAIGVVRSPFHQLEGMPNQPKTAKLIQATVEVFPEFVEGLEGLDAFSHIILLNHLHRVRKYNLMVIPFMHTRPRGVFSTRAPKRPNPIGLSVVKLLSIDGNILHIQSVDILDGTPVLDIKPFVPELDQENRGGTGSGEKNK